MAEAIVGPLVGKLQEMAVSEAKALVAVNDDIRGLRDRLMWMQAFLRHADPRRRDTSDELIRVWLKQTRDVAFDAEDAIDDYSLKVDLSRYEYIHTPCASLFLSSKVSLKVFLYISIKIKQPKLQGYFVKNKRWPLLSTL